MFFNWACVPSSNCVGAECFKDACSKDAVFFSLGSCGLVEAFFPPFWLFRICCFIYGSRVEKQCEAAFHDVLLGMLNNVDKSSAGLLQPKWAVAWRLLGCNVLGNSKVATFLSSSTHHRQQKIIFLRLSEASATGHSFSFIPRGLATNTPCRTDPWCLIVWFRLRALGCPAPDESLCEARGF